MHARSETSAAAGTAIWCTSCGIPYAPGTPYCANCHQPLIDPREATGSADPDPEPIVARAPESAGARTPESAPAPAPAPDDAPPGFDLDAVYPAPPGSLLDRIRKRPQALSEDQVEAAAAEIIARARAEMAVEAVQRGDLPPAPRDALALLPDLLPDPVVEDALRRRRERDRAWLIAGFIASAVLILIAIAYSRYLAAGIPLT